ncbi:MAG: hypothetical protein J0L86_05635 [Flavobacteriales bacterium]|nr:hypothetical protein [Flavobacteriales bacterium]
MVNLLNEKVYIQFYYPEFSKNFTLDDENLVILIKYYLTLQDDDFYIKNFKRNIEIIEDILIDLDYDHNIELINQILEFIVSENNSNHLIFNSFNEKTNRNEFGLLKNVSSFFKSNYPKEIAISENLMPTNVEFLTFCFEVDDDALNKNCMDNVSKKTYNISGFKGFLDVIMPFIVNESDKKLRKLLVNKILDMYEKSNFNVENKTLTTHGIKEKIGIIKALK